MRKKQSSRKRQQASATRRSQVEAEIAAKISKAKMASGKDAPSNGDESKLRPSPILGEISNNQITVTAAPWVSPDEVRRQYESLRNAWFWKLTPSERRVELLHFVTGFSEGYYDGERGITGLKPSASWRQITEHWNRRYPKTMAGITRMCATSAGTSAKHLRL